ncbi:MAG: response regulator [Synergistaceae bacterium]|nr:response regulator [Synergistaceae bacterium]
MTQADQKKIFLVDDNATNLTIGKNALIGKYNVYTIPSGEKLLKMLEKIIPDMILLDIEMPEMDGYEAIKIIKSNESTASIPVIFLTAKTEAANELEGLTLGAIDYITKPFSPPLLLKRIEVHLLVEEQKNELKNYNDNLMEMVEKKTQTVVSLQNAILKTVAEMVECRDDITGAHIERTQAYLQALLEKIVEQGLFKDKVSSFDMNVFVQSAQLHDVGKIAIKDSILQKNDKLTPEEFEEMKTHTVFGEMIINKISKSAVEDAFLYHAKIFAISHHEKWDGSGYPIGLAGEEIPLEGRLMAIADVYDALVSARPYKKPFSPERATEIISEGSGKHFDPTLVEVFLSIADKFKEISETIV